MVAEKSIGTKLRKLKSGLEQQDTLIANLTSIGEFGIESEEIDVTTLDSTGGFREFVASLKDAGEIELKGFTKSEGNVQLLLGLANSQKMETWEVETPSGSVFEFDGFVKSFKEGEATVDGARNFTASIRISGEITYTPAGS